MIVQFYFFLNHDLCKTERTPKEHYRENPYQTPLKGILSFFPLVIKFTYSYKLKFLE
jgi:hypothetical protein